MKSNIIPHLFDVTSLSDNIQNNTQAIAEYKAAINTAQNKLYQDFEQGTEVDLLVRARSYFVDEIINKAWKNFFAKETPVALLGVGGYGREELHPHSDVDILLLFETDIIAQQQTNIEGFLMFLWDIGLEIGSSVRTIAQCFEAAKNDITIATNIVESRRICGSADVYSNFEKATSPTLIWSSKDFFEAKCQEQEKRYEKYHDTGYNLEPNIKESPGGLRDIHMIGWITKRHFGDKSLDDLVTRGFLTEDEFDILQRGQSFLWKVRFALHKLSNRREDRLGFEQQRLIAKELNFKNETSAESDFADDDLARPADGHRLAVELFMKQYYRTVKQLSLLNDMLLQHYKETILFDGIEQNVAAINSRFRSVNNFIEVTHANTFTSYPFALLEIFLLIQQNRNLKGIRSTTIRLLRENLHLIDQEFRNDLRSKSLFMEILKQPSGVTFALRNMNRYGILARYLPEFGRIVGQMQFDLFHIYTVDEHTLFVVRNMRRFYVKKFQHEFPLCSQLMRSIPKPELLYIAGLYHDIAKGRGGDHSILGEDDARQFCENHGLSQYDTDIVAWLVRNHLLMSATAQHKDLSDPDIICEFAAKVENNVKLDYLYLLTVADIRGTNSSLWNSWKDSLLKTLRHEAQKALRRGLNNPLQKADLIEQAKSASMQLLNENQIDLDAARQLWEQMGETYFLRYTPQEIYRHTKEILANPNADVITYVDPEGQSGGTDIFLRASVKTNLFVNSTRVLDNMNLNIVEARIVTSANGYSLNTYTVLDYSGNNIHDPAQIERIKQKMLNALGQDHAANRVKNANIKRRAECFIQTTDIAWEHDESNRRTIMEVITTDRPGLLSNIAFSLMQHGIETENAKIVTLGAHVDDVFFICDKQTNDTVSNETMHSLKQSLIKLLDCR